MFGIASGYLPIRDEAVLAMASILVVERDPNVCTVLTDALESELSAFVQCTTSAREGAKAIESGSFDLAIIDAGLPDLFGIELARRAAHMNIPPLLTSGQPSHIEEIRSLDLALLTKPFRLSDLIFVSAQVIAQAQETLDRAEASFAEVDVSQEALQAEITESRRLISEGAALLVDCKLPSSGQPPTATSPEPGIPSWPGDVLR
jgi:DNA-binding response OmpR family regulator